MDVEVSLATTGETVYSSKYSEVNDLRVWELRLQICHEMACPQYFSLTLFHGRDLLDDTALVADYNDDASEGKLQLHLILRELRPPTDEERRAIINRRSSLRPDLLGVWGGRFRNRFLAIGGASRAEWSRKAQTSNSGCISFL